MKWISCVFLACIAASCTDTSAGSNAVKGISNSEKNQRQDSSKVSKDSIQKLLEIESKKRDSILLVYNLVDIQTINKDVYVDLKYATTDNFMKIVLYEKMDRAFLQREVATRLSNCQDYLTKLNPTLHLLVYDAARPESVQWKMWNALDSIPAKERGKFISNPTHKSVHNFGAAVDLTICDSKGKALDMGAGFDDIREIAYPSLEQKFLAGGELTKVQIENRKLLRQVMRHQKFRNIPTEWWHFNACSREQAMVKYKLLKSEI
jgi:D-alanyl-D-alanine dipeptidase